MNRSDFNRFAAEVAAGTGCKSDPSRKSLDQWFRAVAHIPAEAIPELSQLMTQEWKRFPANFGKAVVDEYRKLAGKKGNAVTYESASSCVVSQCDNGLLYAFHPETGNSCVFRCLTCNRKGDYRFPGAHMNRLIEAGWVPWSVEESYQRAAPGREACNAKHNGAVGAEVERIKKAHGWA